MHHEIESKISSTLVQLPVTVIFSLMKQTSSNEIWRTWKKRRI